MDTEKYYQSLHLVQLNELLESAKEEKILNLLKTFTCSKNEDLEDFLHNPNKAIKLEKLHRTRTYLYLENISSIKVIGYFSITLKVLDTKNLSKTLVKKLDGIDKTRKYIPCYLIAQLGKDNKCQHKIGQSILDESISIIKSINKDIGGRFIILDSVNEEKVIKFYTEEPNSFILLDKKDEKKENLKMYYPII